MVIIDPAAALRKLAEARELLTEAYDMWRAAEIRRCRERIDEAFGELYDHRGWND